MRPWCISSFSQSEWGNAHVSFPNMWSQSRTVLGCSELQGPMWGGRKLCLSGLARPLKAQARVTAQPWPPRCPPEKTCDSSVLVHLACSNNNHKDWVASKLQKFISPRSGGWEVPGQGAGKLGVWREPASWTATLSPCPPMAEGVREPSGVSYKGINPCHECSALMI